MFSQTAPNLRGVAELTFWQKFWIALVLIVFAYYAQGTLMSSFFPRSQITVVGVGKVSVKPTKASFFVTRINTSTDAVNAINEGDAGITALINTTKASAGDVVEIKKAFYQITPKAGGYQVSNAFSVTTPQVDTISETIKTLYRDGATILSPVTFTTNDESATAQQARELAVKDGKAQAQRIAKASGKRLGKLLSIADDNAGASSAVGSSQGASSQTQSQTPFENIEIAKRVQLVYELW